MDFFQNTFPKENNNMMVEKISKEQQPFSKNNIFQLSHEIKNHRRELYL